MPYLHLVRHGQTQYNVERRMQGWCDSPLTPDGLAGAEAASDHLRGVPLQAAYSSPSGRTVTTARRILAHHPRAELTTDEGLREFGFGVFEAQPEHTVFAQLDALDLFTQVLLGEHPGLEGGESGAAHVTRVLAAFGRIEAAHEDDEHVLVVSHGVSLLTYLARVDPPSVAPLPNASITVVHAPRGGPRAISSPMVDPYGHGRPPLPPAG